MRVPVPSLLLAAVFVSTSAFSAMLCEERFEPHPSLQDLKTALESLKPEDQLHLYKASTSAAFDSNRFGFIEKIRDSYDSPQPLYNLTVPAEGGAVLFHGNVFVEGYFRHSRVVQFRNAPSTAELAKVQRWLKWHPESKTYTLERGGTQSVLLKSYVKDGKVRLFRGLRPNEVSALQKVKAGDTDALNNLFTQRRDAIFFTPDEDAAKKWAQGYYIELTLEPSEFNDLYVGIETNYLEVAIPSPELLQRSLKSLKVHRFGK